MICPPQTGANFREVRRRRKIRRLPPVTVPEARLDAGIPCFYEGSAGSIAFSK